MTDGVDPALALRLRAELAALGLAVELVDRAIGPDPHAELDAIARDLEAVAALRVVSREGGVTVWIADRVTGKLVLRQVPIDAGAADADAAAALGAVELLRASLMEVRAPHRVHGEVAATPVVEELAGSTAPPAPAPPPRADLLAVEVAPALGVPGFDSPPVFDVLIGAHARIHGPLGIALLGLVPVSFSRVEAAGGEARVHFGALGGGLRLGFGQPDGRWHPGVGAGFLALFFKSDGRGAGTAAGHEELVVTASPVLRAGIGLALTPRLRLTLDALAGWSLTPIRVQILEDVPARFGTPWLAASVGVEVWVW